MEILAAGICGLFGILFLMIINTHHEHLESEHQRIEHTLLLDTLVQWTLPGGAVTMTLREARHQLPLDYTLVPCDECDIYLAVPSAFAPLLEVEGANFCRSCAQQQEAEMHAYLAWEQDERAYRQQQAERQYEQGFNA